MKSVPTIEVLRQLATQIPDQETLTLALKDNTPIERAAIFNYMKPFLGFEAAMPSYAMAEEDKQVA